MNLSKIKEIFQAYSIMVNPNEVQSEIAAKRLLICQKCEFAGSNSVNIKICTKCGCVLKAKAFSKDKTACPEKKWTE